MSADKTTIADYKPPTGTASRLFLNPLSRLVHGNAAGYANNASGQRALRECQRRAAATLGPAPDDARARQLTREGYLALQPPYETALLQKIRERAGACFDDPSAYISVGRGHLKAQRMVLHPERHIPELNQLLTSDVSGIIESYFHSYFACEIIRLWRNYPLPQMEAGADHYSNLWHNDYDLITRLRFFVLLTDNVTPETGAMQVLPISQTKRIMRAGYVRRDAIYWRARSMVNNPTKTVFFTGDLGSAFIMNPQLCLHRASVPRKGTVRDVVQFTFLPSNAELSADWVAHLPDDPEIHT